MTCHHREDHTPDSPLLEVGDAKRCRCQMTSESSDHCHQLADGEDMQCGACREICKISRESGTSVLNLAQTDIALGICCTELRDACFSPRQLGRSGLSYDASFSGGFADPSL